MEHISRLTTSSVDILLIIADTSRRGLQAAIRINDLAKSLNIGVGNSYLIINQTREETPDAVLEIIKNGGLELAGTIPEDRTVYEYDLKGRPTIEIPENNQAVQAAFEIFAKLIT